MEIQQKEDHFIKKDPEELRLRQVNPPSSVLLFDIDQTLLYKILGLLSPHERAKFFLTCQYTHVFFKYTMKGKQIQACWRFPRSLLKGYDPAFPIIGNDDDDDDDGDDEKQTGAGAAVVPLPKKIKRSASFSNDDDEAKITPSHLLPNLTAPIPNSVKTSVFSCTYFSLLDLTMYKLYGFNDGFLKNMADRGALVNVFDLTRHQGGCGERGLFRSHGETEEAVAQALDVDKSTERIFDRFASARLVALVVEPTQDTFTMDSTEHAHRANTDQNTRLCDTTQDPSCNVFMTFEFNSYLKEVPAKPGRVCAILKLYYVNQTSPLANLHASACMVEPWDENTIAFHNEPGHLHGAPERENLIKPTCITRPHCIINVTHFVEHALRNGMNRMDLKITGGATLRRGYHEFEGPVEFGARESVDEQNRPVLLVFVEAYEDDRPLKFEFPRSQRLFELEEELEKVKMEQLAIHKAMLEQFTNQNA